MTALNVVVVTLILISAFIMAWVCYKRKSWVMLAIVGAFLVRAFVTFVISGDLQYIFVIDSLAYEQKAWYLIQPSMTADTLVKFGSGINSYNYYDYLLSYLFAAFGNHSIVAPLTNCFLASLSIFFIYRIQRDLLSPAAQSAETERAALITVGLAAIYPSYIVWSSTNIRDPLYFLSCIGFLYFSLLGLSKHSRLQFQTQVATILSAAFFLWLILGLRAYILPLFLVAGAVCFSFSALRRLASVRASGFILIIFSVIVAYALQIFFPDNAAAFFRNVTTLRDGFSNAGFANLYAQSSFGVDQTFTSVSDFILFFPNAIGHYFLGPFPWEVRGLTQAVSLVEAAIVYVCVVPTLRGIALAYRRAPFTTTALISFVFVLSVTQALVIGNMGTIYRHRTLSLLVLLIFTGEGFYGFAKKNTPAVLAT